MSTDRDDPDGSARTHAWDWFSLHTGQRLQTFNFFLVATAFVAAGYATLLDNSPKAAAGVALVGAWIAYWFTRLDRRARQLIRAGEAALRVSQARLAERAQNPSIKILEAVEQPERHASSYSLVIAVVEWSVVLAFAVATIYAAFADKSLFSALLSAGE
jgi:hypothetical protein